jgi:hypothetical protein
MDAADSPLGRACPVVVICAPVDAEQARELCGQIHLLLDERGVAEVICDVHGYADLTVIDALARIHLLVARRGAQLRVLCSGDELVELLALSGLNRLRMLVTKR